MYLYATYKRKDLCVTRRATYQTFCIAVDAAYRTAHCTGLYFVKERLFPALCLDL